YLPRYSLQNLFISTACLATVYLLCVPSVLGKVPKCRVRQRPRQQSIIVKLQSSRLLSTWMSTLNRPAPMSASVHRGQRVSKLADRRAYRRENVTSCILRVFSLALPEHLAFEARLEHIAYQETRTKEFRACHSICIKSRIRRVFSCAESPYLGC